MKKVKIVKSLENSPLKVFGKSPNKSSRRIFWSKSFRFRNCSAFLRKSAFIMSSENFSDLNFMIHLPTRSQSKPTIVFAIENNQQNSVSPWLSIVVLVTVFDKVGFPCTLKIWYVCMYVCIECLNSVRSINNRIVFLYSVT